ncbi:unnamed protein product, partial [Adineta steineri]
MTIGSLNNVQSENDQDFQVLTACRKDLCEKYNYKLNEIELSMGMSHDYERAIQAGSTMFMEYTDADPSFRARLLEPKFEPESFIGSI